MERDEVLRMARQAWKDTGEGWTADAWFDGRAASFERFAALVAAAERIKHQAEIQRLTTLANTAEKWRGIAMSRDGDGRTVQEVQAEAVAAEREACAKLCEKEAVQIVIDGPEERAYNNAVSDCAAAIRARK